MNIKTITNKILFSFLAVAGFAVLGASTGQFSIKQANAFRCFSAYADVSVTVGGTTYYGGVVYAPAGTSVSLGGGAGYGADDFSDFPNSYGYGTASVSIEFGGSFVDSQYVFATGYGADSVSASYGPASLPATGTTKVTAMAQDDCDSAASTVEIIPIVGNSISGTVYTDEGSTTMGAGRTVRAKVNGAGDYSTTTASNGTFTISGVSYTAGQIITLYLDGATEKANVVMKAPATPVNLTGINLYQNRVILRDQQGDSNMGNSNLSGWTSTNDGDMMFSVSSNNLTVASGAKLLIWGGTSTKFTPGGSITTTSTNDPGLPAGDVGIQSGATLNMAGNNLTVGGDFVNSGTYTPGANTTTLTGTGFLHSITPGGNDFYNLTLNGSNGATSSWYVLQANTTVLGDFNLTAGTIDTNNTSNYTLTINGNYTRAAGTAAQWRASTIKVGGNWTSNEGSDFYDIGTSTVEMTGTGTITTGSNARYYSRFYNLKVGQSGGTTTLGTETSVKNQLFLGTGTFNLNSKRLWIGNSSDFNIGFNANPLQLTAGGTFGNGTGILYFYAGPGNSQNIPAFTYNVATVAMHSGNLTQTGDVVVGNNTGVGSLVVGRDSDAIISYGAGGSATWNTSTYALTVYNALSTAASSNTFTGGSGLITTKTFSNAGTYTANSGTLKLTGNGTVLTNTGTFTVGTGTVEYASASTTGTTIAGITYNNLTINTASNTFTAGGAITVGATLTVTAGTFSGSNVAMSVRTLSISSGATFTSTSGTLTMTGTGTVITNSGTFNHNSGTVTYVPATATATTVAALTYNNLTVNKASTTFTSGGTITVNSALTVSAGTFTGSNTTMSVGTISNSGVFTSTSGTLTITGTGTVYSGGGTFNHNSGTVTYVPASAVATTVAALTYNNLTINKASTTFTSGGTMTVGGTLTVSAGTFTGSNTTMSVGTISNAGVFTSTSGTLTITGNGTVYSGAGTFNNNSGTISFTSAATTGTTIPVLSYNNLILNKTSNTFTAAGNLSVAGALTLTDGTLDRTTTPYTLTVTGAYTQSAGTFTARAGNISFGSMVLNGGTFNASSGNTTVAGSITNGGGAFSANNGTLILNATGNLPGYTYQNLTINSTFTTTLTGSPTVSGTLTNNGTLALSSNTATLSGNITNAGTINVQTGNLSIGGGTITNTSGTINGGTGTVTYTATRTLPTAGTITYNNLTFNGSAQTFTIGGTLTVGNNFTISLGTVSAGTNTITIGGNFSNSGTFTKGTSVVAFNDNTKTSTISGATDFHGFSVTTAGKNIRFTAGQTFGVSGNLTLTGSVGSLVNINSSTSSSAATINFTGTASPAPTYTSVTYMACQTSSPTITMTGTGNVNGGNNGACWSFAVLYTISGTVYTDEGTTAMTTSRTVAARINGGATAYTATAAANGTYTISNVPYVANDIITVFLDNATEDANVVMKASATPANLSSIHLYQNRVIVRDEGTTGVTNTNLDAWDSGNDADMMFTVTTGALTVASGAKLIVWTGDTFVPGGTVTTTASSSAAGLTGDILIQSSATLNAAANAVSVGGDFVNSGTYTTSGTTTFTATATGHTISGSSSFSAATFNGASGGWTLGSNTTISGTLTLTNGTLSVSTFTLTLSGSTSITSGSLNGGTSTGTITYTTTRTIPTTNITYNNLTLNGVGQTFTAPAALSIARNFTLTNGTFTHSSGTVTFTGSGTVTGAITFSGVTINASVTTTLASNVTIAGNLANSGTISAGSTTLTITGSVTTSGSFTAGTSTVTYNASAASATVGGWSYNIVNFNGSSKTYTLGGNATFGSTATVASTNTLNVSTFTLTVSSTLTNNGTINGGTSTGTITYTTTRTIPTTNITYNNLSLNGVGQTFTAPAALSIARNFTLTNGTFTHSSGTVTFTGSGTVTGAITFSGVTINASVTTTLASNVTIAGNLANSGTISAGSTTLTITGSVTTSGSFTAGTSTVTYNASAASATVGGWSYNIVNFNGSSKTYTLGGNATFGSTATVASTNTLNVSTFTLTVSSTLTNNGTINGGTSTGTIAYTTTRTIPTTNITYNNLTLNGSGQTFTVGSALAVPGNLTVTAGTLTAGVNTVTLGGNFANSGTFTAGTGTVTFNDNTKTSTISGTGTAFNNVTVATAGKNIRFTAGETFTINGLWTMTGSEGNLVVVDSSTGNTQATINHQGTESITYTSLKNMACSTSPASTEIDMSGTGNVDNGNNGACFKFFTPISVSGVAYSGEGGSGIASASIVLRVNGGNANTATTDATGAFTITNLNAAPGAVLTVYINDNAANANTITLANGSGINDLNLYQNRVVLRSETTSAITNTNLDSYDTTQEADGDLMFGVSSGALTVSDGAKLIVATDTTFTPGGNITTSVSSTPTSTDGDLEIQENGTFNPESYTITLGGDYANYGTVNASTSTFAFNASASGHTLKGNLSSGGGRLNNLTINSNGVEWTVDSDLTLTGTLNLTAGTLTGEGNLMMINGTVTGSGTMNFNSNNNLANFKQVSNGGSHSCAVTTDGDVYCWGSNSNGQIGNGTSGATNITSPTRVLKGNAVAGDFEGLYLTNIKEVTAGNTHTCAVSNAGNAYCWGQNTQGQIGNAVDLETAAKDTPVTAPVRVVESIGVQENYLTSVVHIASGGTHTCATTSTNGSLYCWGYAGYGALGDGQISANKSIATRVLRGEATASGVDNDGTYLTDIVQVDATNHTCAVSSVGNLYCWGQAANGKLGDAQTTTNKTSPVRVKKGVANVTDATGEFLTNITEVAVGATHTCAVSLVGNIYCWGSAQYGKLGDSQTGTDRTTPVKVDKGGALASESNGNNWIGNVDGDHLGTIERIAVGDRHSCAVSYAGNVYCWGDASVGQVGDNQTATTRTAPVKVIASVTPGGTNYLTGLKQISANGYHTCAVASGGNVLCWGLGSNGQIGDGQISDRTRATGAVVNYDNWSNVSTGFDFSCGLTNSNKVYCWGNDDSGQLGDDQYSSNKITPVPVAKGAAYCSSVENTDCDYDGNYLANIKKVTTGDSHACALSYSGYVYCWGDSTFNQIGDNSAITKYTPVRVNKGGATASDYNGAFLSNIADLSASGNYTCAVSNAGNSYCWGDSSSGQLGDGQTSIDRAEPVRVNKGAANAVDNDGTYLTNTKQIMTAVTHACAVSKRGYTYCWGNGANGAVGDGTTAVRSTPVKVVEGSAAASDKEGGYLTNIKKIAGGLSHTCATSGAGRIYCWGDVASGQVGDGQLLTDRTSPVQVLKGAASGADTDGTYLINIADIASGDGHTCASSASGNMYCWGDVASGQVGDSQSTTDRTSPVKVVKGEAVSADTDNTFLNNIRHVAAGSAHSCAVSNSGRMYCWGSSLFGQLGDNQSSQDKSSPVAVRQIPVPVFDRSKVIFNGTNTINPGVSLTFENLQFGNSLPGSSVIQGSGNTITVRGQMLIHDAHRLNAGSLTYVINDEFINNGQLNAQTSTFQLSPSADSLYLGNNSTSDRMNQGAGNLSSTKFNVLTSTTALQGKTLEIQESTAVSASNLTLAGTADSYINMTSSNPNNAAYITFPATLSVEYVNVTSIQCTGIDSPRPADTSKINDRGNAGYCWGMARSPIEATEGGRGSSGVSAGGGGVGSGGGTNSDGTCSPGAGLVTAAGTATISAQGAVNGITITNCGSGYTTAPTVSLQGGGGAGATARANLGTGPNAGRVVSIEILTGGSGYTSAPVVVFTAPTSAGGGGPSSGGGGGQGGGGEASP